MRRGLQRLGNLRMLFTLVIVTVLLYQDSFEKALGWGFISYLDEIFILVMLVIAVFRMKEKIPSITIRIAVFTVAFLILGVSYCIAFSEYELIDLVMSSFLSVKFFLLLIAITIIRPPEGVIEDVFSSIKILGAVSAVAGILNFVAPYTWTALVPVTFVSFRFGLTSVMGLFIHQSQYGWFMMFTALLYYSDYKIEKRGRDIALFIVYVVLAILSLKMKVVLGAAAVLVLDLFVTNRFKIQPKKLAAVLVAVVVLGLCFGDYISRMFVTNILGTTEASAKTARYVLLNTSFVIMAEYFPFGVGFGKYASYYAKIRYSEYYYKYGLNKIWGLSPTMSNFATDTFWPYVIGETGIIGLILYVYIIAAMIIKQIKYIWDTRLGPWAKRISYFGFFVIVEALVETMGEPIFNSSPQNLFIGCAVGISLCAGYYDQNAKT